jgi:hypothetical protein
MVGFRGIGHGVPAHATAAVAKGVEPAVRDEAQEVPADTDYALPFGLAGRLAHGLPGR